MYRNEFPNIPKGEVGGSPTDKTPMWIFVRRSSPENDPDDIYMRVHYINEPNGKTGTLAYTLEKLSEVPLPYAKAIVVKPRNEFDPSKALLPKAKNKTMGLSFWDNIKKVQNLRGQKVTVPKEAMKSNVGLIPQQYHETLEWRPDPELKHHWMLEIRKPLITVEDYLRTASFLLAVRTETETETLQDDPVVADDVDEKVWAKIREKGAFKCLAGVRDIDSDSDEGPSGEERDRMEGKGYYVRWIDRLLFVLEQYDISWKNAVKHVNHTNELSSLEKTALLALLEEDYFVYLGIVFRVLKFRERPSQVFGSLFSSRHDVAFVCSFIEWGLKRDDTKFRSLGPFLVSLTRELLTGCWSEELDRLREHNRGVSAFNLNERPEFQSAEYFIRRSELQNISIDLQATLNILKEANQAGFEWSTNVAVPRQEVLQDLTERHLAIGNRLQVLSSCNVIPDNMCKNILQLLADTLDAITAEIHQLIRDVGAQVPYIIDNVPTRFRVDTVLESMNVSSDIISWNEQLRLVTEDVSAWFSTTSDEIRPPDENALWGSGLDYDSDSRKHSNDFENIIARIQEQSRSIGENVDHLLRNRNTSEKNIQAAF